MLVWLAQCAPDSCMCSTHHRSTRTAPQQARSTHNPTPAHQSWEKVTCRPSIQICCVAIFASSSMTSSSSKTCNPLPHNGISAGLDHEELFTNVCTLVRGYLLRNKEKSAKVVKFVSPKEIRQLVDLELRDVGVDDGRILELCQSVMEYSINTCQPHFYNQLFTGIDEIGLLAQFITAATNTSMYTFEMAPVYSIMEAEVLGKMRELIGWEGSRGDGIFSPGGSFSNIYGLLLARYHRFPESKAKGIRDLPQMAVFCSEQSHYSNLKGASLMGLGMEQVIKVKCDCHGKMVPEKLEIALETAEREGICPLAVVATAGTTVLGAFDPLEEIGKVCRRRGIWLHVDGCLGASALVSRTYRSLGRGMELADSVSWNPHKSLGVPLQCSAFLTRHENLLGPCNSSHASYLFQQDKIGYDVSYDTGDKSLQCGRLNDVFKLWLIWKQKGTLGFEQTIDHSIKMARYLAGAIKEREGFQLIQEPEYTNVCFWYFPPKMRDLCPFSTSEPIDESAGARLTKVAPQLKYSMVKKGSMMFTYQPLGKLPNFFRMALATPTTHEDMDWLLDEMEILGKDIFVED